MNYHYDSPMPNQNKQTTWPVLQQMHAFVPWLIATQGHAVLIQAHAIMYVQGHLVVCAVSRCQPFCGKALLNVCVSSIQPALTDLNTQFACLCMYKTIVIAAYEITSC
jgi:hypothetical protein